MTNRWGGVFVLALAFTAYGCQTANGGDVGVGGMAGEGGMGGMAGVGGMGGEGGSGGTVDLCMDVDCSDGNDCTDDVCNPADGTCDNPQVTDGTTCDFGGVGGICMSGVCEDALLCMDVDCSDGDDCTEDLCDPADGTCDNPPVTDGTTCDFSGVGGVCMSGMCEDALLCMDVDCDDSKECTDDVCDPVDGSCVFTPVTDGTTCDFSGVGGVCMLGLCEDALLCMDVVCDDSNECTDDVCDPVDGSCVFTPEADGTICDASGLPGECDTGVCVATCTPTPGLDITLPTMSPTTAVPEYVDVTNGFEITAPVRDVTIGFFGFGANAARSKSALDADVSLGDSLVLEFFDMNGVPSTATNVMMVFSAAGTAGSVEVIVDDGTPTIETAAPGGTVLLSTAAAHKIQISIPVSDTAQVYWESLSYDHECL